MTGIAAAWTKDYNGTKFLPGAFARSIRLLNARRIQVPVILNHDIKKPVGEVLELRETAEGLEMTATFEHGRAGAEELIAARTCGDLGLSVRTFSSPSMESAVDGCRSIADCIVSEITITATPATLIRRLQLLDRIIDSRPVRPDGPRHAALPDICQDCAMLLTAGLARPVEAFDLWQHCEHHGTLVEAMVEGGRVTRWSLAAPCTVPEFQARVQQRQQQKQHGESE